MSLCLPADALADRCGEIGQRDNNVAEFHAVAGVDMGGTNWGHELRDWRCILSDGARDGPGHDCDERKQGPCNTCMPAGGHGNLLQCAHGGPPARGC